MVNKRIEKENFVFDDKGGKFYMYSSLIERFTDNYRIEVYSLPENQERPEILEVRATLLQDGTSPKFSPKGSKAFLKMNYNKMPADQLFYAIDNFLGSSSGCRRRKRLIGDDVYMLIMNNHDYIYVTKEQYQNPDFDHIPEKPDSSNNQPDKSVEKLHKEESQKAEGNLTPQQKYEKAETLFSNGKHSEGAALLEEAAKDGHVQSQCSLARCYQMGEGVAKDYAKAFEWHMRAAGKGYSESEFDLGCIYENGWGVSRDFHKAIVWYRKAAEQGHVKAQYNLGIMNTFGRGIPKNQTEAYKWFSKAADQGYPEAFQQIGYFYEQGWVVEQDYCKAHEWYLKAAKKGNIDAQFNLGIYYLEGIGVEKDYDMAFSWFTQAAMQGLPDARTHLAEMFRKGQGAEQDYGKALELHTKAAEEGSLFSQYYTGVMYRDGLGTPKDIDKAIKWFTIAAQRGLIEAKQELESLRSSVNSKSAIKEHNETEYSEEDIVDANSQYSLGESYEELLDYKKAIEWYTKAAEQGHRQAQYNLGLIYKEGKGVEQNFGKATKWFSAAARQGDLNAKEQLSNRWYTKEEIERMRAIPDDVKYKRAIRRIRLSMLKAILQFLVWIAVCAFLLWFIEQL